MGVIVGVSEGRCVIVSAGVVVWVAVGVRVCVGVGVIVDVFVTVGVKVGLNSDLERHPPALNKTIKTARISNNLGGRRFMIMDVLSRVYCGRVTAAAPYPTTEE